MYHFPSLIFPNSKNGINQYVAYNDKNVVTWKQKLSISIFRNFFNEIFKIKKFLSSNNNCSKKVKYIKGSSTWI